MSGDLYSDYMRRQPHPASAKLIRRWHGNLLSVAIKDLENTPRRVFEVGPGHGYFADHCRERGIDYEFCDTSPAVVASMNELGHRGHLGLLHEVVDDLGEFDLVWMSHVLEHSPTWLDARQMIATSHQILSPNGVVVIVSPDVLNWRREFWNVDWSHGYPTSIRNVSQLCSDVGFQSIRAKYHRNGSSSLVVRALISVLVLVPHRLIDRLLTPVRYKIGDGFTYSWKCVFGWRQIMVRATK